MTMAAITPPEGPEDFFAPPSRRESAEFVPLVTVVLPETGLWRTELDISGVVVGVEIGGGDDNDDGIPVTAGGVELGTGPERDNPSGTTSVTTDVKVSTTVIGVGVSPMSDAGTSVTTVVGTRMVVVRVRLSCSSYS
jgi:hypothetical protein